MERAQVGKIVLGGRPTEKGSKIIDPIMVEVSKGDDKLLFVELYLL